MTSPKSVVLHPYTINDYSFRDWSLSPETFHPVLIKPHDGWALPSVLFHNNILTHRNRRLS